MSTSALTRDHSSVVQFYYQLENLSPALDDLLRQLESSDDVDASMILIEQCEVFAATAPPNTLQKIIDGFGCIALQAEHPPEMSQRCVTGLRHLIPFMTEHEQFESALISSVEVAGDESVGVVNTQRTVMELLERGPEALMNILLGEIVDNLYEEKQSVRAVCCAADLLDVLRRVMLKSRSLSPQMLGQVFDYCESICEMQTARARYFKKFPSWNKFLLQIALPMVEMEDDFTPSLFFEAIVDACLKGDTRKLITSFITGDPCLNKNKSCFIWVVGEIAQRKANAIAICQLRPLYDILILDVIKKRQPFYAVMTLSKMWLFFSTEQQEQILFLLKLFLAKETLDLYGLQKAAVSSLAEIGRVAQREKIPSILDSLTARYDDPNDAIRLSVIKALKVLVETLHPNQFPRMVKAILGSLNDRDGKVRKVAARALLVLMQRNHGFYLAASISIRKDVGRFHKTPPDTRLDKWEEAKQLLFSPGDTEEWRGRKGYKKFSFAFISQELV